MKKHTKLPHRVYCSGKKKMVSLRLPTKLIEETAKLSDKSGWTITDIVMTALDQHLQWENKNK